MCWIKVTVCQSVFECKFMIVLYCVVKIKVYAHHTSSMTAGGVRVYVNDLGK